MCTHVPSTAYIPIEICIIYIYIYIYTVETTGSFSEDTIAFLHELANRIRSQTHDPLQYIKLCQRLSICVQNFNCASIMGCCTLI